MQAFDCFLYVCMFVCMYVRMYAFLQLFTIICMYYYKMYVVCNFLSSCHFHNLCNNYRKYLGYIKCKLRKLLSCVMHCWTLLVDQLIKLMRVWKVLCTRVYFIHKCLLYNVMLQYVCRNTQWVAYGNNEPYSMFIYMLW